MFESVVQALMEELTSRRCVRSEVLTSVIDELQLNCLVSLSRLSTEAEDRGKSRMRIEVRGPCKCKS